MKFILEQKKSFWILKIVAKSDNFPNLDNIIMICSEELTNWPNVRRMSYDQWYWKKRQDAEKFIMFFKLKYSESIEW